MLSREENEKLARLLGFRLHDEKTRRWIRGKDDSYEFIFVLGNEDPWPLLPEHDWHVADWSFWRAYDIADPRTLLDSPDRGLSYLDALRRRFSDEDYGLEWVWRYATPTDIARAVLEAVDGTE